MKHTKEFDSILLETEAGPLTIEGPVARSQLEQFQFHEELTAFRPADKQFEALLDIAELEESRIIIARTTDTIIGYVTYLHPDPLERWSKFDMEDLIELGAIEIIRKYRGSGVGSTLLRQSMKDPYMENYIVISTEYYWHWDLDYSQLSIWDYRKVMEKMMAAGGLLPAPTDEPEINSHPANCLMVRIGSNVPQKSIERFDKLRFLGPNHY